MSQPALAREAEFGVIPGFHLLSVSHISEWSSFSNTTMAHQHFDAIQIIGQRSNGLRDHLPQATSRPFVLYYLLMSVISRSGRDWVSTFSNSAKKLRFKQLSVFIPSLDCLS